MSKNDIIKITEQALEHIGNFDDWIDEHLANIKDYTDTASDLISPLKSFMSIVSFVRSRKFKSFLKSYAEQINRVDEASRRNLSEKMSEYLERPKNLNMIYESIDGAIQAHSKFSASCIGYIAGVCMANQEEVNNKTFILISAFRNLNDFELMSAVKIIESIQDHTKAHNIQELKVITLGTLPEYTMRKLINIQVLEPASSPQDMRVGAFNSNYFMLSEVTEEFFDVIKDSGVLDQMKKEYSF